MHELVRDLGYVFRGYHHGDVLLVDVGYLFIREVAGELAGLPAEHLIEAVVIHESRYAAVIIDYAVNGEFIGLVLKLLIKRYCISRLKIELAGECRRDIYMAFFEVCGDVNILTAVYDSVDRHALVSAASHAFAHGALRLRIHQIRRTELLCGRLVRLYYVAVVILITHQHVLIVSEDHLGRILAVVIQRIRQAESEAQHDLNKHDTEDEQRIVRHVLEHDPQSEPVHERPCGDPSCLGAFRSTHVVS